MASFSEQELQQACNLLAAEFPDLARSVLERTLRDCDLDMPAARRKLLERQADAPARQAGPSYAATSATAAPADAGEGDDAWFDWNKSMRDLGLESFGAQLSLLGRQVATSLNNILPAELNPFGYDEDELEEEAAMAAAKAAADAEREKQSSAVGASTRQLAARRAAAAAGRSPASSRRPTDEEEEEEEEDYDKLN